MLLNSAYYMTRTVFFIINKCVRNFSTTLAHTVHSYTIYK